MGISLRVHATNVIGSGAASLVSSLLPALEELPEVAKMRIFLPESGVLAGYTAVSNKTRIERYQRFIPRRFSRSMEALLNDRRFRGDGPFLVLGDLPLRGYTEQVLFVQQAHLISPLVNSDASSAWKFRVARWIFRANLRFIKTVIVQTKAMGDGMLESYPELRERIVTIPQPPPIKGGDNPARNRVPEKGGLRLFYPAAPYLHKNHGLFGRISESDARAWPIKEMILTIPESENPNPGIPWIRCVGRLTTADCMAAYRNIDALVFPSVMESYGLPLVEAMSLGIPVVCADRPYAHAVCGEGAIYFDPDDPVAFKRGILELEERLSRGWKADWSRQLAQIPGSWEDVARRFVEVCACR